MNETLSTVISSAINNPDCAFLTGMFFGGMTLFKIAFGFMVVIFLFNALNKLALNPFLDWIKEKLYGKRNDKK